MQSSNPVTTLIRQGLKLYLQQGAKTSQELYEMAKIPYASLVGSLMYLMVCCRPNITYAMSFIKFMGDLGKTHWESVKVGSKILEAIYRKESHFQEIKKMKEKCCWDMLMQTVHLTLTQ